MTIQDDLIRDEGVRLTPYKDTLGVLTIGIGRNLDDVGITEEEALGLLKNDISRAEKSLDREIPWWVTRPEPVRRALINMCFQLGMSGLLAFKKMLACLQAGDYEGAKAHALDSLWAKQTPERAKRVTELFTEKEHG